MPVPPHTLRHQCLHQTRQNRQPSHQETTSLRPPETVLRSPPGPRQRVRRTPARGKPRRPPEWISPSVSPLNPASRGRVRPPRRRRSPRRHDRRGPAGGAAGPCCATVPSPARRPGRGRRRPRCPARSGPAGRRGPFHVRWAGPPGAAPPARPGATGLPAPPATRPGPGARIRPRPPGSHGPGARPRRSAPPPARADPGRPTDSAVGAAAPAGERSPPTRTCPSSAIRTAGSGRKPRPGGSGEREAMPLTLTGRRRGAQDPAEDEEPQGVIASLLIPLRPTSHGFPPLTGGIPWPNTLFIQVKRGCSDPARSAGSPGEHGAYAMREYALQCRGAHPLPDGADRPGPAPVFRPSPPSGRAPRRAAPRPSLHPGASTSVSTQRRDPSGHGRDTEGQAPPRPVRREHTGE
ncbi:hypothetical protein SAMN05421803_10268 [Nocardiopsis flavescens]|uniref:Uncharacterized protein n=1 Tax=Nocardiopsis flavescens TaxID=758803 RepID=A0A1M6DYG0_9ACTN|nr:hypothetical protein SAMN05421803_10268 [Nocardiopsis flavescens]